MLLSITIDTTHPDAQGDARTAIKLLQGTFSIGADGIRLPIGAPVTPHPLDQLAARGDRTTSYTVDESAEAPEPVAEANPTPTDVWANIHARAVTSSQTAAIAPSVNSPARRLIPGTDVYVPVDVNGLPWDKRIHASTQAFVADGSWRRKPKVSDLDFARISDELAVIMTAPEAPPPPSAVSAALTAAEAFAQPAPQPEGPTTFIEFMTWIGGHSHAQRLTLANVSDVMAELGLVNAEGRSAVALIDKRPDLIPSAYQKLSALLPAGEG